MNNTLTVENKKIKEGSTDLIFDLLILALFWRGQLLV
jgi:hypothetical protein